jgi:hypothetical protein
MVVLSMASTFDRCDHPQQTKLHSTASLTLWVATMHPVGLRVYGFLLSHTLLIRDTVDQLIRDSERACMHDLA